VEVKNIHRYLAGEAPPVERKALERWLEESEENRKTFETYRDIYEVEIGQTFSYNTEEALEKFRAVMDGKPAVHRKPTLRKFEHKRPARSGIWIKAAAVILVAAGLSFYVFTNFYPSEEKIVVEADRSTIIETEAGAGLC